MTTKDNSKKKPSRARLQRFAGVSLRSKIDRMYVHLERQHNSLLKLLDKISMEQYKLMNQNGSMIKLKKKIVDKIPHKVVKTTHTHTPDASMLKLKYALGDKIFIDTLKQLGKPSLTTEIAEHVKPSPQVKKIAKNKKCLMRMMYNSAFNLSRNGEVQRTPVGKKSFEYSLVEWNKRGHSAHRKSA